MNFPSHRAKTLRSLLVRASGRVGPASFQWLASKLSVAAR
jgi:hypothetical protein